MKIKALHIASFGGLKNKDLDFQKPFNVVYGDNENGKTTIMNFIKMMFYGTERGSAQISKNMRKKYTPWDNSAMSGSIDFELKNRNFRIEREFGNSNSTDKVTLIDLDLGTRESVSADIGVKLFSLSPAAFERSVFIGQFGFPESNSIAEGELNSKLSNITLTGDEAVSFDAVKSRLENAKFALMSKSGRAGEYDKNLKSLKELEARLETAKQNQLQIELAKETANKIILEIENLQQKADAISRKIEKEQDYRNAEKLRELLDLKQKLDTLNSNLKLENGQLVDEMFVKKVEFCISKIDNITQKINAKQSENKILKQNLDLSLNPSPDMTPEKAEEIKQKISDLETEKENLRTQISALENTQKVLADKRYKTPLISGIIFTVLGIVLFVINLIAALSVGGVGLILLCLSLILNQQNKSKINRNQAEMVDLRLKENQLISVITSEKTNLTAINTALNSNSAIIEKQKEMLESGTKELEHLQQEKQVETETLFQLFARFKPISDIELIKEELSNITQKASYQKEIKQNINYILKDVGNISYETAREKLAQIQSEYESQTDFESLKTEYQQICDSITDRKTTVAGILAEVKAISKENDSPDAIKPIIENLQKKMSYQKEFCYLIDIAISVLEESFVEMRRSYGSVFEKKASEIFVGITGGKYQNMSISKSFEIAVEKADTFGSKEIDYLSSGTADQAYLSLRMALSELIASEGQKLPILLDDALAQYDDTRAKKALEFLKEYSTDGQIIIFTCHKWLASKAKELQANEILL